MIERGSNAVAETLGSIEQREPNFERLDMAARRFHQLIADGIVRALENRSGLEHGTARCIAHVLGHALGPDSDLAEFGRSGEGEHPQLRDECLRLYQAAEVDMTTKTLIDWLGTYLDSSPEKDE